MHRSLLLSLLVLLAGLLSAPAAEAQILKRARDAARRGVERGTERAVEREATRRADEAVTNAIECALGDAACAEEAREQGREVVYVDADGNPAAEGASAEPAAAEPAAAAATLRPGEGAWANYDFVPGERPLFVDDFSADRVGNFPQRLEFKKGSMEVVEWQGARFLRATASWNDFILTLPETLPERYTVEFDYASASGSSNWGLMVGFDGQSPLQSGQLSHLRCNPDLAGIDGGEVEGMKKPAGDLENSIIHCRLMVDGDYAKVYVNEQRVANVPNAKLPRTNQLYFTVGTSNGEENPALIGNIRVMAGGRELYDALAAEGRVATQGIFFDTGSATLRPESTPTLDEIAAMLRDHADLRLRIEGHTDATGSAEANQRLSEERAAAVRAWLVEQNIDGARLEAAGLGQTAPVADNGTPEGRQQNRRVELVRL